MRAVKGEEDFPAEFLKFFPKPCEYLDPKNSTKVLVKLNGKEVKAELYINVF